MRPISITSPSKIVSIPISRSFAVSLMLSAYTSIKIHSKIGNVVFVETAFETMLREFNRFTFEHFIFMLVETPFEAVPES